MQSMWAQRGTGAARYLAPEEIVKAGATRARRGARAGWGGASAPDRLARACRRARFLSRGDVIFWGHLHFVKCAAWGPRHDEERGSARQRSGESSFLFTFFIDNQHCVAIYVVQHHCFAMRGRPIGGLRWLRNERLQKSRRKRLRARWRRGLRNERPPSAPRKVPRKHLGKRRVKRSPPGARGRRLASRPRGLAAPTQPVLLKPSLRRTSPRCWAG